MRYFLDGTWEAIPSTVSCLSQRRNATATMAFHLKMLLELRRDAVTVAKRDLEVSVAARLREEEEQNRLMAHWAQARNKLAQERERLSADLPATGVQARAREPYLKRLDDEVARSAALAEAHRRSSLNAARVAENAAQSSYHAAQKACEATERLRTLREAEERRISDRRAEDGASDLAQADLSQRKTE